VIKATLLRARRLAEDFADRTVSLFAERAEKLGRALGAPDHAIRVFSESAIRSHVVFQVSKLVAGLLRRIRQQLKLPAWEVVVAGQAAGRVRLLASLEEWGQGQEEPAVILLKSAVGDEQIPRNVAALVLAHEMPHLSHLGVRARQAGVVFVSCEERSEFERLQTLVGQVVSLQATPDHVVYQRVTDPAPVLARVRPPAPRIPPVRLLAGHPLIALEQAVPETSGGKAAGAWRLASLSRRNGAGFVTPRSLVVPFGVMEAALAASPELEKEYRELVARLDHLRDDGPGVAAAESNPEFATATRRLRQIVQHLPVPGGIASEVSRQLGANTPLIVRSSANCEDLPDFAGAGLYESVINVSPSAVDSAIRTVWSSLWTDRAARSRSETGIPHGQAHMAVLIQELLRDHVDQP